jgi:hypothetical protein
MATLFGGYSTNNWKAHVTVENSVNFDPERNFIFIGVGKGVPFGTNNEPVDGDRAYVRWQNGASSSSAGLRSYRNGTALETQNKLSSPGYEVFMTYYAASGILKFELDAWNSGGTTNVNGVFENTMYIDASSLTFTGDTEAHIFFGGNATATYSDFWVDEVATTVPPSLPQNVYTVIGNMSIEVKWDASIGADSYDVKRAPGGTSDYLTIASGLTDLTYTDTNIETNEIYHYVVAATNQYGASDNSVVATGKGFPYDIIGPASSYPDTNPVGDKGNLFDGDLATFYDTTTAGSWVGVDLGTAQQVLQIDYVLRNWNLSVSYGTNATFEGSNDPEFLTGVEILYTMPATVSTWPTVNSITVTNTTSFRYVRVKGRTSNPDARPMYFMAELNVVTSENIQDTSNGTLYSWLDTYYDVDADFGGDYEAADISDTDMDGLLAWEEYVAGTIPTDANSVLKLTSAESIGGNNFVITWQSVEGKSYSILTNLSLTAGTPGGVAASGIIGVDGETSVTSSLPAASSVFYEIGVQ